MPQTLNSLVRDANAAVRSGQGYAYATLRPGQGPEYPLGGRRRIFAARVHAGQLQVQPLASTRWYAAHEDTLEVNPR
jgi:hypothetical protein